MLILVRCCTCALFWNTCIECFLPLIQRWERTIRSLYRTTWAGTLDTKRLFYSVALNLWSVLKYMYRTCNPYQTEDNYYYSMFPIQYDIGSALRSLSKTILTQCVTLYHAYNTCPSVYYINAAALDGKTNFVWLGWMLVCDTVSVPLQCRHKSCHRRVYNGFRQVLGFI